MNESAETTTLHLPQKQNFKMAFLSPAPFVFFFPEFWLLNVFNLSHGQGNKTSTNTAWYLYSFWALFVLYEAQLDNKHPFSCTCIHLVQQILPTPNTPTSLCCEERSKTLIYPNSSLLRKVSSWKWILPWGDGSSFITYACCVRSKLVPIWKGTKVQWN